MKVILILIISGVFLSGCNSGSKPNQNDNTDETEVFTIDIAEPVPDNSNAEQEYNSAAAKWKQNNVSDYYLKVHYGAFSPLEGIWEIWVENGVLSSWKFNGTDNLPEHKDFALNMTMDTLFELAKQSYMNKADGMFLIYAEFDSEFGYVKSVSNMVNPDASKPVPTDRTFRYEVLECVVLG